MSEELPNGWAEAALPEVASLNMGQSPPSSTYNTEGRGLPFFQGKAEFGSLHPTPQKFCSAPTKSAESDDILISVRAPVGPTNLCHERSCIERGLAAIRPHGEIPTRYLLFYLRSIEAWLATQGTGSTFTAISKSDLEQLQIRLAPLAEQRRIVVKLETLLGKVDACQQRLAKIPVLLKRFRQSVLAAACSGRLTADWREEKDFSIQESWRDAELRDICSSITDGDHLPPPKQANGIPFLTIGNISSGRLDFSQTRFVSESYFANIKPDRIPRPGDTLYTVVGATIGIPVLVDVDRRFCFQRHIAILKPSEETTPEFLHTLMGSPAVFRETWARITGSAQPTLPLGNLRTIPVSVPPLSEQQEIVRRVDGLFALADQLEQRLAKARGQVDKLTPSLLARAFAGKLVPQDPTDEPALALLQRIRTAAPPAGEPAKRQ